MSVLPIPFTGSMILALQREIEAPGTGKTMTRRVLKPQPPFGVFDGFYVTPSDGKTHMRFVEMRGQSDFYWTDSASYAVGDLLYVRETYWQFGHWEPIAGQLTKIRREQKWGFVTDRPEILFDAPAEYRGGRRQADPHTPAWHKRHARFMPRSFSRTTLKVTAASVQRVRDISEEDARAEGVEPPDTERDEHDWTICPRCGGTRVFDDIDPVSLGVMPGTDCTWCDTCRKRFRHLWDTLNEQRGFGFESNPWVSVTTFTPIAGNVDAVLKREAA